MKWTQSKVNKLTRNEVIALLDKVEGLNTVESNIPTPQLKSRLIGYINKGLV